MAVQHWYSTASGLTTASGELGRPKISAAVAMRAGHTVGHGGPAGSTAATCMLTASSPGRGRVFTFSHRSNDEAQRVNGKKALYPQQDARPKKGR